MKDRLAKFSIVTIALSLAGIIGLALWWFVLPTGDNSDRSDLIQDGFARETAGIEDVQESDLIARSIEALRRQSSLAAKIRFNSRLADHRLLGTGAFLQQSEGPNVRTRLELKIPTQGRLASLLQVNTGDDLWIYERLIDKEILRRVDLRKLARLVHSDDLRINLSPASLAAGGIAQLLQELRHFFHFTETGTRRYRGTHVTELAGRWRPVSLGALVGDASGSATDSQEWSANASQRLPDEVLIYLGSDDLFPYLIEYRQTHPERGRSTMLTAEIYDVQIGGVIDPTAFEFLPQTEVDDITDEYAARWQ